jgi:hypothetical protein
MPGPISVLGEVLRIGQYPSPTVILCAIAEAEAIGRQDLAADIVNAFVAPIVHQHGRLHGAQQTPMPPVAAPYERGSCSLLQPRHPQADYGRGACATPYPLQVEHTRGSCAPRYERGSCAPRESGAAAPPASMAPPQATQDEILAMLHADPNAFLAMMSSGRPPASVVVTEVVPAPPPPQFDPQLDPPNDQVPVPVPVREVVDQQAVDQAPATGPGSPLGEVSAAAWGQFLGRLVREPTTFSSARHVGQYRQRRERLEDLGIDPGAIHGSAVAQRSALDADLVDAYRHASAGGLTEHLSRSITVPGHEMPQTITLSGLLGVIQCAGLEGAVGWLERSNDRKRYPHTTQVFLRTNGVF